MKNIHVNHFLGHKYVCISTCKFGFILVPSQGLWAPGSGWCPVVSCICRVLSPPTPIFRLTLINFRIIYVRWREDARLHGITSRQLQNMR